MSQLHIKLRHCKWSSKRFIHDEACEGAFTLSRANVLAQQTLPCARDVTLSWVDKDADYIKIASEVGAVPAGANFSVAFAKLSLLTQQQVDLAVAVAYAKTFQNNQLTLQVRRTCTWPNADQCRKAGFIALAVAVALLSSPLLSICILAAAAYYFLRCRRGGMCGRQQPLQQQPPQQPQQPQVSQESSRQQQQQQQQQQQEQQPSQPQQPPQPQQPQSKPHKYAEQLETLKRLGFVDALRNVQALIATNGDVTMAVSSLIGE